MNRSKKERWNRLLESYIDRILSMQNDRILDLFDTGVHVNLKELQRVTYKKVLKLILNKGKIAKKRGPKRGEKKC